LKVSASGGLLAVALLVLVSGLSAYASSPPSRGITIEILPPDGTVPEATETLQLYGASHALVIGVDDYRRGWPVLRNAVKDARAVAAALKARGFSVDLVENPESRELRETVRRFFIEKGADPEARLFLWFAGHGHSLGEEGFIVPADGALPSDQTAFRSTALHLRDIGNLARLARARHGLAVFDSCFSGSLFSTSRSAPPPAISHSVGNPVRQFLTSGEADQKVSDDGLFRRLFLEALDGKRPADANGDGYLTGSELGLFMGSAMANYTANRQTPRFGTLNDPAFDKGDFVFLLDGPKPVITAGRADAVVWNSIRDSDEAEDFRLFLETYPASPFAPFARRKLDRLGKAVVPGILQDQRTLYVAVDAANVRSGPGTSHSRLDRVVRGQEVSVTGRVDGRPWFRISRAHGGAGFIHASLLSAEKPVARKPVRRLQPGDRFRDCPDCPDMLVTPTGSFRTSGGEQRDLAHPFGIGIHEVTRAEWQICIDNGGCEPARPEKPFASVGSQPVTSITRRMAEQYLVWLSGRTGQKYRLPSDDEWDFAASSYGAHGIAQPMQEIDDIRDDEDRIGPMIGIAGLMPPTSFGLHGMRGGVREWVADCRLAPGGTLCAQYLVRGGASGEGEREPRSVPRVWFGAGEISSVVGFRVARDVDESELAGR
jgi:formylglycine-generating enzyme required for sulfatase activity